MNSLSKKKSKWCLYILKCGDGTLYTGITNDLARRVKQHNDGSASRYTRSRLPVKLVYQESCRGRSQALKKEFAVKSLSRKDKENYIKKPVLPQRHPRLNLSGTGSGTKKANK